MVHEEDDEPMLQDTGLVDAHGDPIVYVLGSLKQGFIGYIELGETEDDESASDLETEGL